jgi:hypothetical protein
MLEEGEFPPSMYPEFKGRSFFKIRPSIAFRLSSSIHLAKLSPFAENVVKS